jgi:hypothetical protein
MEGISPASSGEGGVRVREGIVSGIFYPDDPKELAREVDALIRESGRMRMDAAAIVSPHAALCYSGSLQAKAFCAARSRTIRTVVLLGPRHRPDEPTAFLPESAYFRSPLGDITVDLGLVEEIESLGTFYERNDIPHMEEHAIEVQLPFIQRLYPDAAILPIILGSGSGALVEQLALDLDVVLGERLDACLFVAVSNLGAASSLEDAAAASEAFLSAMMSAQPGQGAALSGARGVCGADCIRTLMLSKSLSGRRLELLGRSDSTMVDPTCAESLSAWSDLDGEVVEYGALAFY